MVKEIYKIKTLFENYSFRELEFIIIMVGNMIVEIGKYGIEVVVGILCVEIIIIY